MPTPPERPTEVGATATEYVLILAFIALVAAVGITRYGAALGATFDDTVGEVETAPVTD